MVSYTIKTDLPPEAVTRIGIEIYAMWVEFALGQAAIGGRRLINPTGRYAAAIQFKREGESAVAIVVDETSAPEAYYIEHGHGAFDLKTKLRAGKPYRVGKGPSMWGELRSFGPNSPPGSWILPAMPAYAPSLILSSMMREALGG